MRRQGLFLAVSLAALMLFGSLASARPAAVNTWAGVWNTDFGKLTLDAGGSGSYAYSTPGTVSGAVTSNVDKGTWSQPGNSREGTFEFTMSADGHSFTGTWAYKGGGCGSACGWSGTCSAGECMKNGRSETVIWPKLPDAEVPLVSVSNGCGGGPAGNDPKWGDDSEFVDSEIPFADPVAFASAKKYYVNFREACKQHDAGYSHAKVRDMPLNGGRVIDYFTWTKAQIDDKFLIDMRKICDDRVPKTATVALNNCRQNGGFHLVSGAKSRYNVVAATTYTQGVWKGLGFYQEPPKLTGTWSVPGVATGPWSIVQVHRSVLAKWTGGSSQPSLSGEFRGTIISHDADSTIEGFYVITDNGTTKKPRAMTIFWSPKTPDQLRVSTGFTLTR